MNSPTAIQSPAQAPSDPEKLTLDLADRLELGARLRRLREATGLTTLQVAEQVLGYKGSHAAVSRLERGVFAVVNRAHLDLLAQRYGSTTADLLAGTDGSDTAAPPVVTGEWGNNDVAPGAAQRLRDLRQALGLTHKQFSERMGLLHDTHYKLVERGDIPPRPDLLLRIAMEFDVSGSWLILGKKARIARPTQALRVRAMRLHKGLSRPALAVQAMPQEFEETRVNVARCEGKGVVIPWNRLQKLAKAFDVPPEFLDPQGQSQARVPLPVDDSISPAQSLYAAEQQLPKSTQKLLEQVRTTAALGMLTSEDTAWLLKQMSVRTWKRPQAAA